MIFFSLGLKGCQEGKVLAVTTAKMMGKTKTISSKIGATKCMRRLASKSDVEANCFFELDWRGGGWTY